jgi:hypothetical protein
MDTYIVGRTAEDAGNVVAQHKGVLIARPQFNLLARHPRDIDVRFEVEMVDAREGETVFEHVVGGGQHRLGIAVAVAELGQDVRSWLLEARHALADLDRQAADRRLEQQRRIVGERLRHRHHRRQKLVVDLDQAQGAVRGLLVRCGDRRDHVADVAHLVERDDRLVADRDAVIRIGQGCRVGPGHDRDDTRQRLGAAGVDRDDARMRVGAAQHLGVEHAWHADVAGIACRASDLVGPVERGNRRAERQSGAIHHPACALAAAWTASMIIR